MANAKVATVTLELTWDEARALTALTGRVNGNNLDNVWGALTNIVGDNVGDDFEITSDNYSRNPGNGTHVRVLTVLDLT